jgi:hypothetical protein
MTLMEILGLVQKQPPASYRPTGNKLYDLLGIGSPKPAPSLTPAQGVLSLSGGEPQTSPRKPTQPLTGGDPAFGQLMRQLGFPLPDTSPKDVGGFTPLSPKPRQPEGFTPLAPAPKEVGGFSPLERGPKDVQGFTPLPPETKDIGGFTPLDRELMAMLGLGGTRKNETPIDEMIFYRGQMVPTPTETEVGSKRNISRVQSIDNVLYGENPDEKIASNIRQRAEALRVLVEPLREVAAKVKAAEERARAEYDKYNSLPFGQRSFAMPPELVDARNEYERVVAENGWSYGKSKELEELEWQFRDQDRLASKYEGRSSSKKRHAQIADENSDLLYLTSQRETAEAYANQREGIKKRIKDPDILFGPEPDGYAPTVYEMRGKFDKTLDLTEFGEGGIIDYNDAVKILRGLGVPEEQREEIISGVVSESDKLQAFSLFRGDNLPIVRKALTDQGYDSVHYTEGEQDNWIVLDRSKVRQTNVFPLERQDTTPKTTLEQLGLDIRTRT